MMTRGATLLSGGGGVEALLKQRIDFVHAVEYDPAIAGVYRQNHGDHIQVARVEDVDYEPWGMLDYLHASPVCKNASQAKTGGMESDTDIQTALAVVRCLEATQPRVFTLENVWGYRNFQAFRRICQALDRGGYMWHFEHLNAADFGVPQTRKRLILRAVRDSLLPSWPAPEPWVGWHAAIEDLIPTLPESKFADWQLKRLPDTIKGHVMPCYNNTADDRDTGFGMHYAHEPSYAVTANSTYGKAKAFIVGGGNTNKTIIDSKARFGDEPIFTVPAGHGGLHSRAFLMRDDNTQQEWGKGYRDADETAMTIRADSKPKAWLVEGQAGNNGSYMNVLPDEQPSYTVAASADRRPARAWLSAGRVVKMTPRALARFQSLPDSYVLPDKSSLACTIIGNMVPSLMMQKIVEPLL